MKTRLLPHLLRLCLICLPVLFPGTVSAKPTLVWAVLDFPPFQILSGPHAGSGSFDGELQALMAAMPEYEHRVVTMSFSRRKAEFLAGTPMCTPGIFLPPAQALKLAISRPALTHLDNRVVYLPDKAHRFGSAPSLDVETLFHRPDLVGGLAQSRSFAPVVDGALSRHQGQHHLVVRALSGEVLFRMLLAGELDYLIMFPHEAAFLAATLGAGMALHTRPIRGVPPYQYTHVACTGNDWGRGMIARIDAVLDQEMDKPAYRALSERWYPKPDQARVRRYFAGMVRERAGPAR